MNKKYISVDEVVEITGLAKRSIYQYTFRKVIPHHKMGRLLRFEEQEVLDWIESVIDSGLNIMGLPPSED